MTMKKRKLNIYLLAFVAIVLVGCAEDVFNNLLQRGTPVEVIADVERMKAPFTRSVGNVNLDGFTVSSTADNNEVYVNIDGGDHVYTISGTAGQSSKTLTEDRKHYFTSGDNSVDVWARYPNEANVTTENGKTYFTVQQDQYSDEDNYQMCDLMLTPQVQCTRQQQADGTWLVTPAELNFKHQMVKLQVSARADVKLNQTRITDIYIRNITVKNIKPRVELTNTFDAEGEPILGEAEGDATDLVLFETSENTQNASGTVLFPPQTIAAASEDDVIRFLEVEIAYREYGTPKTEICEYYFTGSGKTFRGGCTYVMNLEIGEKDPGLIDEYNNPGVALTLWQNEDLRVDVAAAAEFVLLTSGEQGMTIWLNDVNVTDDDDAAIAAMTKTYTGQELELSESELRIVPNDGSMLKLLYGRDYRLLYAENVDVGTARVTIEGYGRYIGAIETKFKITEKDISDETVKVSFPTVPEYNRKGHQPTPTLTDSEASAVRRTLTAYDFDLSDWKNNVDVGTNTASVKIKGKGNYKGSRTEYFSISKTTGSVTFAEPNLKLIRPDGYTFTYTTSYTVVGDGVPTSITSSNESVFKIKNFDVANKTVTLNVLGEGNANINMVMEGNNYSYANASCPVRIVKGPKLPIEYMAETSIASATPSSVTFAEDNHSERLGIFSWFENYKDEVNGPDVLKYINLNGAWKNGIHYHMPSTYEWRSIFPANNLLEWGLTYLDAPDVGIAFGAKRPAGSTEDDDTSDYIHYITKDMTKTWLSDFYSPSVYYDITHTSYVGLSGEENQPLSNQDIETLKTKSPNTICYALRFKGTTYCTAWRYDWVWTEDTEASKAFTGNSVKRKSLVIRVIYMGPDYKYNGTNKDYRDLENLKWNEVGEKLTRRIPMIGGTGTQTDATAGEYNTDRPDQSWYWSGTYYREANQYYVIRLANLYMQGDQSHSNTREGIRLFKDTDEYNTLE